jgi:uncharacterized protein
MSATLAIVSAALLGVSGSMHCALMCGPLAAVVGGGCTKGSLASQAGRATTYTLLGVAFGAAGERIAQSSLFGFAAEASRFLVAATLVVAGLAIVGIRFRLPFTTPRASFLDRLRQRLTTGSGASPVASYARGLAWGLLPCGLLYSALALAVASASPLAGGITMLVFALATMPVFALLALFSRHLRSSLRTKHLRNVAGVVLVGAGLCHLAFMIEEHALVGLRKERPCCAGRHGAGS